MSEENFYGKRKDLVKSMLGSGALKSDSIKNAFLSVQREKFFPKGMEAQAYVDSAFPIGFGQTISQPSTIAIMLEMLSVQKGMRVLEVGAGSGYVVALLSKIVGENGKVFGVEIISELKERMVKNLLLSKTKNFEIILEDGSTKLKAKASFNRIIVSAACRKIPSPLIEQLSERGKLVAPVGGSFTQEMVLLEKEKGSAVERQRMGYFAFVPLKGKLGF